MQKCRIIQRVCIPSIHLINKGDLSCEIQYLKRIRQETGFHLKSHHDKLLRFSALKIKCMSITWQLQISKGASSAKTLSKWTWNHSTRAELTKTSTDIWIITLLIKRLVIGQLFKSKLNFIVWYLLNIALLGTFHVCIHWHSTFLIW